MKTFSKVAILALAAISIVACKPKQEEPTKPDVPVVTPDENTTPDVSDINMKSGYYAIVFQPAEGTVCNDIYFIGNYAESNWTLDAANVKFEKLDKFAGWYIAYIPDNAVDGDGNKVALQGKPIQAKKDGSLSWDFQTGDENSWTVEAGDVTIEAGYSGESNLTYNDASQPVIYKSAGWKNGNSPCVDVASHDYVITIKAKATPYICGGFDGWSAHQECTKVSDGVYEFKATAEEGVEFKITGGSWDNEAVLQSDYNAESACYKGQGNAKLAAETALTFEVAGFKGIDELVMCE